MEPISGVPQIDRGLAAYEMDYYAILGVPITADPKEISDGYKQVAKSLRAGFVGNTEEAKRAQDLFAKLVGPAKEILTKERERVEYDAVLSLRVKRLVETNQEEAWPKTDVVSKLRNSLNWENDYKATVTKLATEQYTVLDEVSDRVGTISELNLAYLLLKNGLAPGSAAVAPPPKPVAAPVPAPAPVSAPPTNNAETRYNQALVMMERRQYKEAIQFLTVAINTDPNDARFYIQRGLAYKKLNNKGMARVDFQQAVKLEPNNMEARQGLVETKPPTPKPAEAQAASSSKSASSKPAQKGKGDGGGFLGGLFKRK